MYTDLKTFKGLERRLMKRKWCNNPFENFVKARNTVNTRYMQFLDSWRTKNSKKRGLTAVFNILLIKKFWAFGFEDLSGKNVRGHSNNTR